MVDAKTGLLAFCARGDDVTNAGTSVRYTAISAIGIGHALAHGMECSIDYGRILDALEEARPTIINAGDRGLLLWAMAGQDRDAAERALETLISAGGDAGPSNDPTHRSTELAWVVLGLGEALAHDIGPERLVRARYELAYRLLMRNRGDSGLMAFARGPNAFPLHWQSTLGFFDAQIYTTLASVRRAQLLGDLNARDVAISIGERLIHHQHPLGQWAWHYNAKTGGLVELYPVYSVHQDGMAPMALLPLEKAFGVRTSESVARGVAWLFGNNELGVRLIEPDRSVIWRSIRRRGMMRRVVYPFKAASILGVDPTTLGAAISFPSALEVDREMRPYHFGWTLLAFSELVAHERRERERSRVNGASDRIGGPNATASRTR